MRLAFCLLKFFPYGGLERDFLRIALLCEERGHTIDIYTMQWEGKQPDGFQIHILKKKGWTNHKRAWNFSQQLQHELKQKKYDVVIGFNKMPGLDIYFAGDSCFRAQKQNKFKWLPRYRIYEFLERCVFQPESKTKILVLTEKQQHDFILHYATPATRFHLLPPGVNPKYCHPENAKKLRQAYRNKLGIKDEQYLLIMVCSYFKTKGLDRSLYALSSLPADLKSKTLLYIAGKDNHFPFIKLANKLKISEQVKFLGAQSELLSLYLAADLLIHPAYHEAAGLVLLEALVAGLPILTTEVCGYSYHVVQANAGEVLSTPFQQNKLNKALLQMLTSMQQSNWKQNAIHYGQKQDLFSLTEKVVAIIEGQLW